MENTDEVTELEEKNAEKTVSAKAFWNVKQEMKSYKEKLEQYELEREEAENARLSEVERLQKELSKRDSIIKEKDDWISARDIKDKKISAFMEAKKNIGDGFILETEVEQKLLNKLDKFSYDDESFLEDVSDLINIAKKPKKANNGSPFNLGSVGKSEKNPLDYTASDLKALEVEDKERYNQVLAERRSARRKK